jgi:hypothetical protein
MYHFGKANVVADALSRKSCSKVLNSITTPDQLARHEEMIQLNVIPNDVELRRDILDEAHKTRYTVHPGSTKMYQDLKKKF